MVKIMESPVCCEPKVFVGSLPSETTTEDVSRLFGRYGKLKTCSILSLPDGRSRGCAMLLYDSWTAAEAAIDAENGSMNLGGAAGKGMVVKFADPPKRGLDGGPVVGLVPRKLFIGQVPSGTTQEALKATFTPFGNIQDLHVVSKAMGAAGCALLTYQKWASAEAAIEAHNGKTVMSGGTGPLVVRFADAKYADGGNGGFNQGFNGQGFNQGFGGGNKRQFGAGDMGMGANKRQYASGMGGQGFNPYMMMGNFNQQGGMQGFMPNNMGAYGMMQNAAAMNAMRMNMAGGNAEGRAGGMVQQGFGSPGFGARGGAGVNDVAKQWKLFVGQIPYQGSEGDLWPVFSAFGPILELTILRNGGKSKGCGFCTYESYASAAAAAQQLNDTACIDNDPHGRKLIVKFANPQAAALAGGAGGAATSSQQAAPQQQQQQQLQQQQQQHLLGGGMDAQMGQGLLMQQGQAGQGQYQQGGQGQQYLSPQMQGYAQQPEHAGMMMM